MASKVYLIRKEFLEKLPQAMQQFDFNQRFSGKSTAIKIHMGEYGNLNYVRPPIVGKCVDELLSVNAKPFVFDSITHYKKKRYTVEDYYDTARRNGFTAETIGCPIVITDNSLQAKGFMERDVGLSKEVAEANALLAISHCKGHMFAGFGGAIKNLGFGAIDQKTKAVVHSNKKKLLEITSNNCFAVLKQFQPENTLFVNVLNDFSPYCDCHDNAPFGLMKGVGIAVSDNIAALDRASIDLMNEAFGANFFEHLGYIDPMGQVEWLEKQGFESEYKLEEI